MIARIKTLGHFRKLVLLGALSTMTVGIPAFAAEGPATTGNAGPMHGPTRPFEGIFKDEKVSITLTPNLMLPGPVYNGVIEKAGSKFYLEAEAKDGVLQGNFFDKDNNPFPFTAQLTGDTISFSTGKSMRKLARVKPVINPLDDLPDVPSAVHAPAIQPAPAIPAAPAVSPAANDGGVGLSVTLKRNGQYIVSDNQRETSPSGRAGIKPGDQLVAINHKPVGDVNDVSTRLTGPVNSTMTLTIIRQGETRDFEVKLISVTAPTAPAPAISAPQQARAMKVSVANLKSIATGMILYGNEHNWKPVSDLQELVKGDFITAGTLTHPLGYKYIYTGNPMRRPGTDPKGLLLIYEQGDDTLPKSVLFDDGEVVTLEATDAKRVIATGHRLGQ